MKMRLVSASILFCISSINLAIAGNTVSSTGAGVYIASPQHGEIVTSTFKVKFGLTGMGVAPAGTDKKNTGHHHLLIDGKSIPDKNVRMGKEVKHFGGGQTETVLTLSAGPHTLQLILGDKGHVQHNPPVISQQITITVK